MMRMRMMNNEVFMSMAHITWSLMIPQLDLKR